MSDIESTNPAVEEPDALEHVDRLAAGKEKADEDGDDDDDDDDDDDEKSDDDSDDEDDSDDDDDDEDEEDDDESDDDDADEDEDDDDAEEDDGDGEDVDGEDGDEDEKPAQAAVAEEAPASTDGALAEVVSEEAVAVATAAAAAAVGDAASPGVTDVVSPDHAQHLRLLEALVFAGTQALDEKELAERLPNDADVKRLVADLAEMYAGRGVNLVMVAGGYAFRTAPDLSEKLKIERPVTRKLSRASVETLAIIAYHQPVTRAEIEQVRGVGLSKGTLDLLFEQNWIKPMGRRRAPGKPVTWGTTDFFLEHFGLPSLDDLPGQEELKAAGLLDARAQPPIFRPDEPDLPLEPTEDEADEPLAAEEKTEEPGR
jgi:segregation and condensation protein B